MREPGWFPVAVVLGIAAIATVTDVRNFRVPNYLTLPLVGIGLLYHGLAGGIAPLLSSLLGMLLGGGLLLLPYLRGGMGGGDVKLMAGVGAWLGVPWIVFVFIATGLAGGVYALVLMALAGRFRPTASGSEGIEQEVRRADRRRRLVPYAAMIAVGIVAVLIWSSLSQGPR